MVRGLDSPACAVVDCVVDINRAAGRPGFESTDVLKAPAFLRNIGDAIMAAQDTFGKVFDEVTEFARDGVQFDMLLKDSNRYQIGTRACRALHTPGHAPAGMTHVIGHSDLHGAWIFQ